MAENTKNTNRRTRTNSTYREGVKKWQVEAEGCFGLWFPMGAEALFDTEREAEAARNDPENLIYKRKRQIVDENPMRFG